MTDGRESSRQDSPAVPAGTSGRARVVVRPTPAEVTEEAAERVVTEAERSITARGQFAWALAGGSTPRALYTLLATPAYANRIDWPRVQLFWGDERCVPPDHPDSNYRMTAEALLAPIPIPMTNVHRVRGEDQPDQAAAQYERELRQIFHGKRTTFDLMLLGMGSDGHTASLFPGLTAVGETQRWVVAENVPAMGMWRVTLTLPAINGAAAVLFLVTGAEKATMLRRVLEGAPQSETSSRHSSAGAGAKLLPVQLVAPGAGTVTWLIDEAAAAQLSPKPQPADGLVAPRRCRDS